MSEKITIDEVRQVAKLSRLKLSEDELQQLSKQMGSILEYVAILDELNTDDVEPMAQAVEVRNAFRADELAESLPREDALANAPASDGRYFLVPDILKKG